MIKSEYDCAIQVVDDSMIILSLNLGQLEGQTKDSLKEELYRDSAESLEITQNKNELLIRLSPVFDTEDVTRFLTAKLKEKNIKYKIING